MKPILPNSNVVRFAVITVLVGVACHRDHGEPVTTDKRPPAANRPIADASQPNVACVGLDETNIDSVVRCFYAGPPPRWRFLSKESQVQSADKKTAWLLSKESEAQSAGEKVDLPFQTVKVLGSEDRGGHTYARVATVREESSDNLQFTDLQFTIG